MKNVCVFQIILFLLFVMCTNGTEYVSPEMFGALGDGINNDAIAFNKCIKSGKTIKLQAGKTYKFDTPLNAINHESFRIEGNGAKIVISKDYPVTSAMAIFVFSMDVNPKLMEIKQVDFICLLEEKKVENAGDTYFFLSKKCDKVIFENLKFKAEKKFSNLTFFRSEGGDLFMDNCDIILNTHSRVGGIFWLMNKSHEKSKIEIQNSSFEYETKDECMCFATDKHCTFSHSDIDVTIKKCNFKTLASMNSSGFIIVYSRCVNTVSNINVKYEKCLFESSGGSPRYIQTYQCGGEEYDFGSFNTTFYDCVFNFSKNTVDDFSEGGLVGLVYDNFNKMEKNKVGYVFNNCTFKLNNIFPIVGDKDACRKGYFRFSNCTITSNCRAFQKKYNVKNSNISLEMNRCKIMSKDDELTYKHLVVNSCIFYDINGRKRSIKKENRFDFNRIIIER